MKKTILAAALSLGFAAPAAADATVGIGLTITFGAGPAQTGMGVHLLSDDEKGKGAATLGVDYMFQSKRLRPSLGVAILGDNTFAGVNFGYGSNGLDLGLTGGFTDTTTGGAAAPAVVPD